MQRTDCLEMLHARAKQISEEISMMQARLRAFENAINVLDSTDDEAFSLMSNIVVEDYQAPKAMVDPSYSAALQGGRH
jgi:hypothetical protein